MSWLPSWMIWWDRGPPRPMRPTDAMHLPPIRTAFSHFLDNTDPPASFRAAQVAQEFSFIQLQSMGYEKWEEVLPAVIELAFEMRAIGNCEILKGGKVLGDDVTAYDIEGGIRVRRLDD